MLDTSGMARYYLAGLSLREWWHLYCGVAEDCFSWHRSFSVCAKIDYRHHIYDRGVGLATNNWIFVFNSGNICLIHSLEQVSVTLDPLSRVRIEGGILFVEGHEIYI